MIVKQALIKSGILGIIAITLGALGAHALKNYLTVDQLASFNTGVRYQIYHTLLIILLAVIANKHPLKYFRIASLFVFWGVILFSGSIYVLTLKNIFNLNWLSIVGPITPIGGLLMIIGWVYVLLGGLKIKQQ